MNSIVSIGGEHVSVTLGLLYNHPGLKATLIEPSRQIIELTKKNQGYFGINDERIAYFEGDLNTFLESSKGDYQLVICHAVMNWVDDPFRFMETLVKLCTSENVWVSLLFGSNTAKAFRFAHQGNLQDLLKSISAPGSPVSSLNEQRKVRPIDCDELQNWLVRHHCSIVHHAGVRIFADLMNPELLKDEASLGKIREAENLARKDERYWKIGQLIHFIFNRV